MKACSPMAAAGLAIGLALVALPRLAEAQFSTNLILNPGAEASAGSNTGGVVPVLNWLTTGNFTAVQYDIGGGFPSSLDPGSPTRGQNFFAGGPSESFSTASQTISLAFGSTVINTGFATYDLFGYFGGFDGQSDNAVLAVSFFDAGNILLGSASVGGVTVVDRGGATGMLFRSIMGLAVPLGADHAELELRMTRTDGDYDDGYADDLSFQLHDNSPSVSSTPEPASLTLIGTGLVAVAVVRRRRRKA